MSIEQPRPRRAAGSRILLAAVAVTLLGACADVANLLLIKAAATRKQRSVQFALGASRGRIAAQIAMFIPARRAARVDPIEALRSE